MPRRSHSGNSSASGFAIEQRPAPGDHHAVEVGLGEPPQRPVNLVEPDADRADRAGALELDERGIRAADRRGERPFGRLLAALRMRVDVVDHHDVHARDAEAQHRVLERAQHAVARVVEHRMERQAAGPEGCRVLVLPVRPQPPSDLGREHELVARQLAQHVAEQHLGAAVAVERRDVEVADAQLPGRTHCADRFVRRDRPVEPAERPGAEAELGQRDAGAPERAGGDRGHLSGRRSSWARTSRAPASR